MPICSGGSLYRMSTSGPPESPSAVSRIRASGDCAQIITEETSQSGPACLYFARQSFRFNTFSVSSWSALGKSNSLPRALDGCSSRSPHPVATANWLSHSAFFALRLGSVIRSDLPLLPSTTHGAEWARWRSATSFSSV